MSKIEVDKVTNDVVIDIAPEHEETFKAIAEILDNHPSWVSHTFDKLVKEIQDKLSTL